MRLRATLTLPELVRNHAPISSGSDGTERRSSQRLLISSIENTTSAIAAARGVRRLARINGSLAGTHISVRHAPLLPRKKPFCDPLRALQRKRVDAGRSVDRPGDTSANDTIRHPATVQDALKHAIRRYCRRVDRRGDSRVRSDAAWGRRLDCWSPETRSPGWSRTTVVAHRTRAGDLHADSIVPSHDTTVAGPEEAKLQVWVPGAVVQPAIVINVMTQAAIK